MLYHFHPAFSDPPTSLLPVGLHAHATMPSLIFCIFAETMAERIISHEDAGDGSEEAISRPSLLQPLRHPATLHFCRACLSMAGCLELPTSKIRPFQVTWDHGHAPGRSLFFIHLQDHFAPPMCRDQMPKTLNKVISKQRLGFMMHFTKAQTQPCFTLLPFHHSSVSCHLPVCLPHCHSTTRPQAPLPNHHLAEGG